MKEHPSLMNQASVNAILAGRQTQDRRPVKPQPMPSNGQWSEAWVVKTDGKRQGMFCVSVNERNVRYWCQKWCPYRVGDHLWVRETHTWFTLAENEVPIAGLGENQRRRPDGVPVHMLYRADAIREGWDDQVSSWSPSIHMPKWATRIWLEIIDVRVERVQDITEEGAQAEGAEWLPVHPGNSTNYIRSFADLWDSIYAKQGLGWNVNPWVFAITFERAEEAVFGEDTMANTV